MNSSSSHERIRVVDNGWSAYTTVQKKKNKRRRVVVVQGPDKRRHSTTRILEDGECEGQSALLDKLKEVRSTILKDKSVAPPPSDIPTPSEPELGDAMDHPPASCSVPVRRGSRKRRQRDTVNVSHEDGGASFSTARIAKRDRRRKHRREYTPKPSERAGGDEGDASDGEMVPKRELNAAFREIEDYKRRLKILQTESQEQMRELQKHYAVVDLKKSSNVLRGWLGLEESHADYAERTHRRHLEEIVLHMSMITHGNKEKQVMLINSMLRKLKVPHPQQLSAREAQLAEVKEHLWEVLKLAIKEIKPDAGGRPAGEHFVVHQIIHSLLAAAVTPKTRHMVSRDLGTRCRSLMNFAGHLERILAGEDEVWFKVRGKVRSRGAFRRTPIGTARTASPTPSSPRRTATSSFAETRHTTRAGVSPAVRARPSSASVP